MVELTRWFGMPHIYTFKVKGVKEYIIHNLKGEKILIPFGGMEKIDVPHKKIDTCDIKYPNVNEAAAADFYCDATDYDKSPEIKGKKYDTIVLDPPFSFFQAVRYYKLNEKTFKMTDIVKAKNEALRHCEDKCRIISLGFNTTGMGKERGFKLKKVAVVNHGGNHNDTLITVEDWEGSPKERFRKKMREQYKEEY